MQKQAIVIRTDLGMGKGKIAAQASHASLQAYLKAVMKNEEIAEDWEAEGSKKIVLKVASEKELVELFESAKKKKLACALIHDAGHTQVEAGSATALAIGPADEVEIDVLTRKLKLL